MSEQEHILEGSTRHTKDVIQCNHLGDIKFLNGAFVIKFLFLITGAEGIMRDEDEGRGVVHYEFGKQRVLFFFKIILLNICIFKHKFIFKKKNLSKRLVRNSGEISQNHSCEMFR